MQRKVRGGSRFCAIASWKHIRICLIKLKILLIVSLENYKFRLLLLFLKSKVTPGINPDNCLVHLGQ